MPQQNDLTERMNQHLTKVCQSMLYAKSVPGRFWAKTMRTATHLINKLP